MDDDPLASQGIRQSKSLETKSVFVREATGLVKSASLFDAVSLNLSSMSGGAALATIGYTMLLVQSATGSVEGINLVWGSIIAFAISLPQMLMYMLMTGKITRTGGDYVWVSRTLGGFIGSTVSFMGYTMETMAYLALITISTVLAIGSVGLSLGATSFLGLALPSNVTGSSPLLQFILGSAIFAVLIALNIVRPNYGYKLVSVTIAIGIVGMVAANLSLLYWGRNGVGSYINSLGLSGVNYSSVASTVSGPDLILRATIFMMPFFAMFVYPWFVASPAVGSEVRGSRNAMWSIPISAVVSLVIVTASFGVMYYVGGFHFINGALSSPVLVNNYSFNFWTLAMGVSTSKILSAFIGLAWIIWDIGILAYGIIVISRYILAQAFDRFLPEKMAYVSSKTGSPVAAHLLDLTITLCLIGGASLFYGTLTSLYGAIVASMIYFVFVGLSAALYGHRRKGERSSRVLQTCGVLTAAVFVFLTYEFLANPGVWGGNPLAYGYVAGSALLGAAIYVVSKRLNLRKGIDISYAYREIPPE
ncbi:MAG: APC family permease [Candidatus Marsarchaeota archaeon]|nr:APC family permease [Candidatus Marsarchaeota archaeon]